MMLAPVTSEYFLIERRAKKEGDGFIYGKYVLALFLASVRV